MNIKHLNEECRKILNETGFAVSGQKDDVNDILAKLTQEYGDLTIPEFIDLMITKEKQGEDVLDESLNEHLCYKNETFAQTLMTGKFMNIKIEVGDFSLTIINTQMSKYSHNSIMFKNVEIVHPRESTQSMEWVVIGQESYSSAYPYPFADLVKKHFSSKYISGNHYEFTLCRGVYAKQNTSEQIQKELALKLIETLQEIDKEVGTFGDSLDSEVEQLQQIKQQVKNSRTTVRQALSKSAIAKKIQALQNPTPEQLARILAAIEG